MNQVSLSWGSTILLMIFLGISLIPSARANSDTLLFESIGELVAGLSYSHTIVSVPVLDLQAQVHAYRDTLVAEFHNETIEKIFANQKRGYVPIDDHNKFIHLKKKIFSDWVSIGGLHIIEVDSLVDRIDALVHLLPLDIPQTVSHNIIDEYDTADSGTLSRPPIPQTVSHNIIDEYDTADSGTLSRPPRAVGALLGMVGGFLLGGAGTLFGTLGLASSKRLKEQLEVVQKHVDILYVQNSEMNETLQDVRSQVQDLLMVNALKDTFDTTMLLTRLRTHYSKLSGLIDKHEKLLQALQTRRLSTTYLPKDQIDALFIQAQRRAKTLGCSLLLTSPSHITQIEVSHFFNGTHLNLILHMPIAPHNSIMRLYKLHPFPLPFANDTFLIPDVRDDVLAVSNTNIRFSSQLSTLELQSCNRINKIYLCERNGVMNKFPEDTCLGALYHQKFDLAKRICHFHVEPAKEFIYQLLNNWFLIYVTSPQTVPITCMDKDKTHFEWHLKTGITRQHLPAGCTADLPRNLLLSDLSILVPQDYVQFDMDWDPVSFMPEFQDLVLPEFRAMSDQLGPSAVSLSTLQSIVASKMQTPSFFHSVHFTFNTITLISARTICCFPFHAPIYRSIQNANPFILSFCSFHFQHHYSYHSYPLACFRDLPSLSEIPGL